MKVEIDLSDVLYDDEAGAEETLAECVRRQVVNQLADRFHAKIEKEVTQTVQSLIDQSVKTLVNAKVQEATELALDTEYTPVDSYGRKAEPTTIRKTFVAALQGVMKFERRNSSYDQSAFTNAVMAAVDAHLKEFKSQYTKLVDAEFTSAVLAESQRKLQERLGIKG